jgi:hypothetical protein
LSPAKKNSGRFSYLAAAVNAPAEQAQDQEIDQQPDGTTQASSDAASKNDGNDGNGGGGGGRRRAQQRSRRSSRKPSTEELATVPKGKGRMKQERSQLNVRIPTALKRRASAKAVLEGRDIGEVVEELLREYLEK